MNISALRTVILLIISFTLFGCATIDPKFQMDKNTVIAIINETGESLYSTGGFSENAGKGITKAIMISMEEKFHEKGISASIKEHGIGSGVAKVRLFVKSTSSGYRVISGYGMSKFEIKYRLILESPESKQLFVYTDEQDDSDMDDVIEKVAEKCVKKVMKYFKDTESPISQSLSKNANVEDSADQPLSTGPPILDIEKGLMWVHDGSVFGKKLNWDETEKRIQNLNYGGYNDWRVPTKEEFNTLLKDGDGSFLKQLERLGFTNIQPVIYWTSSTDSDYPGYLWGVYMDDASMVYINKKSSYFVLPVRSGQ